MPGQRAGRNNRHACRRNAAALHATITGPAELQGAHSYGAGTRAVRMQGADFGVSNCNASLSSNGADRTDCELRQLIYAPQSVPAISSRLGSGSERGSSPYSHVDHSSLCVMSGQQMQFGCRLPSSGEAASVTLRPRYGMTMILEPRAGSDLRVGRTRPNQDVLGQTYVAPHNAGESAPASRRFAVTRSPSPP
jgi:hypothetical protein